MAEGIVEAQIFQETDIALHDHCFNCILPRKCQYLLPEHQLGCTVVCCSLNCGAKFHACKSQEHLLLCPQMKVPCLSSMYGCPLFLKRCEIGTHLSNCPASIVYCSAEWNRTTLSGLSKKQMKKEGRRKSQIPWTESTNDDWAPDVAFALDDQRKIQDVYKLKRAVRNRATNFYNRYHPQLPMIRDCGQEDMISAEDLRDHSVAVDSSDEDEIEEKRKLQKISPVMKDCVICKIDPGSQHLHLLGRGDLGEKIDSETRQPAENRRNLAANLFPKIYTENNLFLNLAPEFLPRTVKKQRNNYTIVCSQIVRRDEFYWHYKNMHNEIINSLDGWSFIRCPLAQYGCNKLFQRLIPKGTQMRHKVRYNSELSTFTVSQLSTVEHAQEVPGDLKLQEIPREILIDITSYLDGASLLCLAATCKSLRVLCAEILSQKGMVMQKWSRIEAGAEGRVCWVQGPPIWTFSKCSHPVSSWAMETLPDLLNHIKICPAFERKKYTEEKIPVLRFLFQQK